MNDKQTNSDATIIPFIGSNYWPWLDSVQNSMLTKGYDSLLDEHCQQILKEYPDLNSVQKAKLARFEQGQLKQDALDKEYISMIEQVVVNNNTLVGMIQKSLGPQVETVRNITNAKLLLEKLKQLHASDTMEAQGRLNRRYHDLKYDSLKGPVVFFNDLMRVRYQMTLSGSQVISETQLCLDFLAKLPQEERFDSFIRFTKKQYPKASTDKKATAGEIMSCANVLRDLCEEYPLWNAKSISLSNETSAESTAMSVTVKKRKRQTGKSGLSDKAKKRKCINCGMTGHSVERCFFDGGGAEKDRPKWWLDQHRNGTAPSKVYSKSKRDKSDTDSDE
ncbi:hypothetical protein MP228_003008 [Amoeboaphelidium protococcarum]|nr:hypothetical protein MP228_003008 [Amoeboaphelidium protococcarum]